MYFGSETCVGISGIYHCYNTDSKCTPLLPSAGENSSSSPTTSISKGILCMIVDEFWIEYCRFVHVYGLQRKLLKVCCCHTSRTCFEHIPLYTNSSSPHIIISNLSNDRSKASSKTIPPHSAI